jgi:plasmid replication initiation protein
LPVTNRDPAQLLPTSVQKSYFMLSRPTRAILDTALQKYRPGESEPIPVGGRNVLKPALRLMTYYRLVIEEIKDGQAVTSYTRWVDAVQVRGAENQEVYVTFSPRFERIWLESKKRLLECVAKKPANIGLRSRYALRLYSWAKKYVTIGTKRISLEQLRKVLGLESVRDAAGNFIRKAPLPVWANLRQRALETAIREINEKTDLNISLASLERSSHRRVTRLIFAIKTQAVRNGDSSHRANIVNSWRGKGRVE